MKYTNCELCGRELKTKKSMRIGIGPECLDKHGLDIAIVFKTPDNPGVVFDDWNADLILAFPHEVMPDWGLEHAGTIECTKGEVQVLFRENESPYEIIDLLRPTEDNIQKAVAFSKDHLHDPRFMLMHRVVHIDRPQVYYEGVANLHLQLPDHTTLWGIDTDSEERFWKLVWDTQEDMYWNWPDLWKEAATKCGDLFSGIHEHLDLDGELMGKLHEIWWEGGLCRAYSGHLNFNWVWDSYMTGQIDELTDEEAEELLVLLAFAHHGERWILPAPFGGLKDTDIRQPLYVARVTIDAKLEQFACGLDVPMTVWMQEGAVDAEYPPHFPE